LSIGESAIAYQLGHSITMAVTWLMVLIFWFYILYKRKERKGEGLKKNGPLMLATIALFLVPIIPTWKASADWGLLPLASIWYPGCDSDNAFLQFNCLSPLGWTITAIGTWGGNLCLAAAMFWQMDFCTKLKNSYKMIRYRVLKGKEDSEEEKETGKVSLEEEA
jgi:hypothetical protein